MSRISQDQLTEWVDNPVTVALWWLYERELNDTRSITEIDCLFRGNPQKTQERLIERAAKEDELIVIQSVLKGEWKKYLGELKNYHKLVSEEIEEIIEEENEDSDEDNPE